MRADRHGLDGRFGTTTVAHIPAPMANSSPAATVASHTVPSIPPQQGIVIKPNNFRTSPITSE